MKITIPKEVTRLVVIHLVLFGLNLLGFFLSVNSNEATVSALGAVLAILTAFGLVRAVWIVRPLTWLNGIFAITNAGFALLALAYLVMQKSTPFGIEQYLSIGMEVCIYGALLVMGILLIKYIRSDATVRYFQAMKVNRKLG